MSTLPAISTIAQLRSARVKCIDFHPFKQQILVALHSGEIIVYDYQKNETLKTMALLSSPIRCARYMSDGVYFAIGSDDGHLRIYDSYNYQLRQNIRAHVDYLRSVVVHPSANVLITAGDDSVIRAWSFNKTTAALELEAEYCGHDGAVMSISSDPQGLRLVSAGQDKTVKIWDISAFQNLQEFRQKVEEGRIGNQMGKREETLMDKMNIKTVKNLAKQATSAVTNYVTNKPSAAQSNEFTPRVKFDALFTLSGHSGCVNSAVWCESTALSGGQENPYAQGCLQFIASVGDDQDLLIWDTYSRQVLKRFNPHQDVINAVYFIRQLEVLVTLSGDNSVSLLSTQSMQVERTLNYGLERGWCAAALQSGASTIMALGFDTGVSVSRVGDFAPVCSFSGSKASRLAVSGTFTRQYSKTENHLTVGGISPKAAGAEIALCPNLSKALDGEPEFKALSDDLPQVIKQLSFSPSGKFFAVHGETGVVVLSALTGKKKFEAPAKQFCFAAQFQPSLFTQADKPDAFEYEYDSELEQKAIYAIVTEKQRRVIKVYSAVTDGQEQLKIKVDFPVDTLFSGPLLAAANTECFVLYDWEEGKFITQLDMQVNHVIWNAAGDLVAVVTPSETHILQVNFGQISAALADEAYDEYNGVDNAVVELACLNTTLSSGAFTTDSKLFVYLNQDGVNQLFLDEVINQDADTRSVALNIPQLKQVIQVLGTYQVDEQTERIVLFGEAQPSYYGESQYLYVAAVNVDKSVLRFKELALQGKLEEALAYAKESLTSRSAIEFAADYLIKAKAPSDIILELLPDTASKLKFAHKLGRYDIVVELVGDDLHMAAEDAFRGGYIAEAADFYMRIQDWPMALLCGYILGDADVLKRVAAECPEKSVQFRAGVLLDEKDVVLSALVSPAQIAAFKRARECLDAPDIEKWKQQLVESNRADIAELVE